MDNNKYKYLKYKHKYNSLKKSLQKGGVFLGYNFRTNYNIYLNLQRNINPCLEHFGVDLASLGQMAGKDKSGHDEIFIGTSRININGENRIVALKRFLSECKSKKFNERIFKTQPDEVPYTNEILICKELTERFLITGILQNIVWFYNGGICGFSYDTPTPISTCSGPKLDISNEHKIYRRFGNPFMDEILDKYLRRQSGDASSFMIVEKCTGSLNGMITQIIERNEILDESSLNNIMTIILQTILTLKYLTDNLHYFMHNDLHPGNVLYTVTADNRITYDLNVGQITIRTFNNLAKIWDFGTSFMDPITTQVNESRGNYIIVDNVLPKCNQDIYLLMLRIRTDFMEKLTPINKQNLGNPKVNEIFSDINTMIEIYCSQNISFSDDTVPRHQCIEDNRMLANLIFEDPILSNILDKYRL